MNPSIFTRTATVLLLALLISIPASAQSKIRYDGAPPDTNGVEFGPDEPVIAAYYFYWYDYPTKSHILNPNKTDALLRHPVRLDGTFSYSNDYWHLKQFQDMAAAGIDIALPVYWGHGRYDNCEPWAKKGLVNMVRVLDYMELQGAQHPALGMFYDTTTLMYDPDNGYKEVFKEDLTTDLGKETVFLTIKSFFDNIPRRHWALYGGKPIVWLYSSAFASAYDETLFPAIRSMFSVEYGVEPFIVAERSWKGAGDADKWYAWGAAIQGVNVEGDLAAIGPGYDDSPVPGRDHIKVDRYDGLFYERNWLKALEYNPAIVVIETWNELHEGTEICETLELGRKYIDLTAEYSGILKLPQKERGKELKILNDLYYNTVTLEPAEVWQSDLDKGRVEFPLYVLARNNNLFGQLGWQSGGTGVIIDPKTDDFTLKKGETMRLDYTVKPLVEKHLMGRLPYVAGKFAVDGRQRAVPVRLELSLIRRIECRQAPGEMNIDAALSDWTGKQATIVAAASNTGGPAAPFPFENAGAGYPAWHPGDASFEFYSCWDSENLYLTVVTRDDIPLDGLKGRDMVKGDCVHIGIELDDDRNGNFDYLGDMEFALAEINGKDRLQEYRKPPGVSGPLDTILRYAVSRNGGMTIYEISIPVLEFDITEETWDEGHTVGINVVMHDDDGSGWEGFIQLSPGLIYGRDTRRFARLVLS